MAFKSCGMVRIKNSHTDCTIHKDIVIFATTKGVQSRLYVRCTDVDKEKSTFLLDVVYIIHGTVTPNCSNGP